ncbi:FG-GAP-like repeat-containing protein [Streptomyces sp. enrichment culture]|uniref:FG-GAP-like repeat-containing protein n=1 Tax=Streptomyces sp. enrichment culture TaxID=1795815 RepID=UPI003F56CFCB
MVLGGAGAVTYAVAEQPAPADGKGHSRRAAVHTLKLADKGGGRKGLARRGTERFSAVVLTWDDPDRQTRGTPEIRTRDAETGEWSAWLKVTEEPTQADGAEGARSAVRGGTESVWTGDSDGIEVRLVNPDGTEAAGQPAGLDVRLLDPGTDPEGSPTAALEPAAFAAETTTPAATDSTTTDSAATESPSPDPSSSSSSSPSSSSATESPSTTPPATTSPPATTTPPSTPSPSVPAPRPSTVVKPPVITQAQWGASTAYNGTPSYGEDIKAAVLHHTGVDSDNKLSCAESRARMRTIQQGHLQQGWFDIGYNFVVDRCGQIFEGRSGGMDLPVIGAHDAGFNTDTLGISYIGNFETARPSRAALDAIARVVAWKFGMYGIDPAGKVTLTSKAPKGYSGNNVPEGQTIELPRVFGHKDTNATACPGANLYPKLGLIRSLARTPGVSHALPTSDYNRDGVTDLVAGTPVANHVTVVPGGTDGPVTAQKLAITQNSASVPGTTETGDNFGAASAWGDVNGDGHADLAIGSPGEDDTSGNADRGQVTVLYGPGLGSGYSYTTVGTTASGVKLGTAVTVGDFDADGKADVFSAGTGRGGYFNVRLTGRTTTYGTLVASTSSVAYLDAATGDFNRDGYADVAVNYRDSSGVGRVARFAGSANGLTKAGVISVKGGRAIAAGDINANGYDDIVIGQPSAGESGAVSGGQVTMLYGTSTGFTTTGMKVVHQDTSGVPETNESGDLLGASVAIGDYDADGYPDVLAGAPGEDLARSGVNQANAGAALLIRGSSAGLTGTGAVLVHQDSNASIPGAPETGDQLGTAVSLTDLSGYGRADLTFGAAGEDGGDGVLLHVPSNSTGLGWADSVIYSKSTLGTPTDAGLGRTLTP